MNVVRLKAPAKVNLFLEVTGQRADGYHTLETLFAKVDLFDDLVVTKRPGPRRVTLKVVNRSGTPVPPGDENLATRAAQLYLDRFGIDAGVAIHLTKRIPSGGGLGGGSSDAGTVLRAMARLFPRRGAARILGELGSTLGADVALFTREGGFFIGKGIGDRLTPVKSPRFPASLPPLVLVYPGAPVATADAYRKLDLLRRKNALTGRSHLYKLVRGLSAGLPPSLWIKLLFNRFEEAVLPFYPAVRETLTSLAALGAEPLMSGSGSCVFAFASDPAAGRKWVAHLGRDGRKAWLVRFLD